MQRRGAASGLDLVVRLASIEGSRGLAIQVVTLLKDRSDGQKASLLSRLCGNKRGVAVRLYGIKTCDTCRKALKALENAGWHVEFMDVRATPLAAEKISEFLGAFGDALVNTRSTTWRGLDEGERSARPFDLLQAHPTLMKRPVIEAEALHLGWGKEVQAALL